ncbi:hypothetical protein BD410DRAFT_794975 [Rickenella mellea]|uniref:Uncharacterized protein n=1 Tax=Rickenella mellea TaxID=50990 RepID=A0A4Y7PPI5_9AGAM|nr:hypothetical protein BD410DRAFT_794975 [Rickenella mellea]
MMSGGWFKDGQNATQDVHDPKLATSKSPTPEERRTSIGPTKDEDEDSSNDGHMDLEDVPFNGSCSFAL